MFVLIPRAFKGFLFGVKMRIELSNEQVQELSEELVYFAATEAGFFTDGEDRYFISPEDLTELFDGDHGMYDFTSVIDDLFYYFILKFMEYNELQKHSGTAQ